MSCHSSSAGYGLRSILLVLMVVCGLIAPTFWGGNLFAVGEALTFNGSVMHRIGADGNDYTVFDVEMINFSGTLPDDIGQISVTYDNGTGQPVDLGLTKADFTYYSQFNEFYCQTQGAPALGTYTFTVTAGQTEAADTDTQTVIRDLPAPYNGSLYPLADSTIYRPRPTFSWQPLTWYTETPLYYRFEIADDNNGNVGERVFATQRHPDMFHFTLDADANPGYPATIPTLTPGATYWWRVRVTDADSYKATENRHDTEWRKFTMAAAFPAYAQPPFITDDTLGAITYSRPDSDPVLYFWVKVTDNEGVPEGGTSHQVKVATPAGSPAAGMELMLRFYQGLDWDAGLNRYRAAYYESDFIYTGDAESADFAGDYLFTVTDTSGNSSSFTDNLTVSPVEPVAQASIRIEGQSLDAAPAPPTVTTTPTFTWDASASPNTSHYRVRIYQNNATTVVWNGIAGDTTCTVPPGVLETDSTYRFRVEARDGHNGLEMDNWARTPANSEDYFVFYTGQSGATAPFIDLNYHGVFSNTRELYGASLSFWVKVHDAQGVPGNIKSVKVTWNDGMAQEEHLYYDPDRGGDTTSGIYWCETFHGPSNATYTFIVEDWDGNTSRVTEVLAANPIGFPPAASLGPNPSLNTPLDSTGVNFSWDAVPGAAFYRVRLFDKYWNRYDFNTTTNSLALAPGFLEEGAFYRYKIQSQREFLEENIDNLSESPFDSYDYPDFMTGARAGGTSPPTIDLGDAGACVQVMNVPFLDGAIYVLLLDADVTDPDGVPENIKTVTVTYPDGITTRELSLDDVTGTTAGDYQAPVIVFADPAEIQQGVYTFTVTDFDGNSATVTDTLTVDPLPEAVTPLWPRPDGVAPVTGTVIDWTDVPGAAAYMVEIRKDYDEIHESEPLAQSYYQVPDGVLADKGTYSYRIFALREDPTTEDVDNVFSTDVASDSEEPHFMALSLVDTDGDGMDDNWEIQWFGNTATAGAATDFDSDALADIDEYANSTNPTSSDTDGDSLTDAEEVNTYNTDPLSTDTDGDGIADDYEIANWMDPLVNDSAEDADGDGLSNLEEYNAGTDPFKADTDGDGMRDDYEVANGLDPFVDDGAADLDGDGLTNLEEYQAGTAANNADSDGDGYSDAEEAAAGSDPLVAADTPERLALIALYNATGGAAWTESTNWLGQAGSECAWHGVTCDGAGHVTQIDLSENDLAGSLPPELGSLKHLQSLFLQSNQLSGTLPAELGNLVNLQHLYLGSNQLEGSIPTALGSLTDLLDLDLTYNQLGGSIPAELGNLSNLHRLELSSNRLEGDIPSQLGNLVNLEDLDLAYNELTGTIPAELGSLVDLTGLYLDNNQFTGTIPAALGNLTKLNTLNLHANSLTGTIPAELENLASLQYLHINDNQLGGPVPPEITNLVALVDNQSDFRNNRLYTDDDTIRSFMNAKQIDGDWESSQIGPITVSLAAGGTAAEGDQITYTATASDPPQGNITVTLSNGATIDIAAGTTSGNVAVDAPGDDPYLDAEDVSVHITDAASGGQDQLVIDATPAVTQITDTIDTTTVELSAPALVPEAGQIPYTATLGNPTQAALAVNLSNGETITIAAGADSGSVTVDAPNQAGEVQAHITGTGASTFEQLDIDATPAVTQISGILDSDGDGMADGYENINGLDPSTDDSDGDLDGDGLSNLAEYQAGTAANNADSDGDKFSDGLESQDQTSPLNNADHRVLPPVTGRIPDTGQTTSYTAVFGEDNDYLINPPEYLKMDAAGNYLPDSATAWAMVYDAVTGLIWEVKHNRDGIPNYADPGDGDNTYTWYDSNPANNGGAAGSPGEGTDTEDFIAGLNATNYGGHSDWRLPTRKELRRIVNYGRHDPSIETTFFPNTQPAHYWSSTTHAGGTENAWFLHFLSGYADSSGKSAGYYVRAVRGSPAGESGELIINGDGTVTDAASGLMWEQKTDDGGPGDKDDAYTMDGSLSWVASLNTAAYLGYRDWRLPTIKELDAIVDLTRTTSPSIDMSFFPITNWSHYRSSTIDASATGNAWCIYFTSGYDAERDRGFNSYVRAVRGGQSQSLDHLIISSPLQGSYWELGDPMTIAWNTAGITGDVAISLSRDGGKTYTEIVASTPNDGSFEWTVTGPNSFNCMLKIEPLDDPQKATTQGLFTVDPDSDHDGMPSSYETANGLDPSTDDSAGDLDGDGLSNLAEYQAGTAANNADSDGDGLPDGYEAANGLDPLADDGGDDPDGDGLSNLAEQDSGTDPNAADSDSDGLSDGEEVNTYTTDPLAADSDGDTLSDGDEVYTHFTNPLLADSDGDTVDDNLEIVQGTDPNDAGSFPAAPGVYYVDIDAPNAADDGQHGTSPDTPWQTIHFAIDRINAGPAGSYTLNVGLGTYGIANGEPDRELQITQPGLSIIGASGSLPLIDGTGVSAWLYGIWSRASSTTIENLEVTGDFDIGIKLEYTTGTGSVRDCIIHDLTYEYAHGIVLHEAGDLVSVEGNRVYGQYGGIEVVDGSPTIARNTLTGNTYGLIVSSWQAVATSPLIENNLITTSSTGILIQAGDPGEASPLIYHNTFYGGLPVTGGDYTHGIFIGTGSSPTIRFNLVTDWGTGVVNDAYNLGTPILDYNDVWNNQTGYQNIAAGPNDIDSDPLYSDAGAGNFDLAAGSPAIDAIPLDAGDPVSDDYLGRTRPLNTGFDMGAYESTAFAVDSDGDGMPDSYENANGLNPQVDDSGADPDGDGLSNLAEYNAGADPNNSDTDGDTLPDGDEVNTYGTNPLAADSDGDQTADNLEIAQGTDPTDADSFPVAPGTYYVDCDAPGAADDSLHGTAAATPWKSLHYAVERINQASAGSYTLNVGLGTYSIAAGEPDRQLQITQNEVAILGELGSMPVIDGTGATEWVHGLWSTSPSVTIDNLELTGFQQTGIKVEYAGAGAVSGCVVHDPAAQYAYGILANQAGGAVTLAGNRVYGLYGGMEVADGSPVLARNTISDNDIGLTVSSWGTATSPAVKNNVITSAGASDIGIFIQASNGGSTSPLIYHNTLYGAAGTGPGISINVRPSGLDAAPVIKFNAITGWDIGIDNRIDQPGTPVIDYNLVWNNFTGYENTAAGANDIDLDPLYADPEAGNFDLADGSPAIDAIPLNAGDPVTDDYLGRTRPLNAGFDMGAYESTAFAADSDGDGMPDSYENANGLDPQVDDSGADPDGDGLSNLTEYQTGTNPNGADTDSDGMPDGFETANGLDPLADDSAADPDGDGLSNLTEYQTGTNPNGADTDGDGIPDGFETANGLDPLTGDSGADPDGDGLSNLTEYQTGTNPNGADTDSDGMPDGFETANGLDPLTGDSGADPDGDGLSNLAEYNAGADPNNSDTDGDTLPDGDEVNTYGTNPLAADSDGDQTADNLEIAQGTDPTDADSFPVAPGTYYVDCDAPGAADDSLHGTAAATPWKSLHYAVERINQASAGSYTLNVGLGTYSIAAGEPDRQLQITQNEVAILGELGSMPVIDGTGATEWVHGLWSTSPSVTIDNLELTGFQQTGIKVEYAGAGAVSGCVVHDPAAQYAYGILANQAGGAVTLAGNRVYGLYGGMEVADGSPVLARNTISDNDIGLTVSSWGTATSPAVKNNVITSAGASDIGIFIQASNGGSTSPLIYHNTLYGAAGTGPGISINVRPSGLDAAPVIKFNAITGWDIGIDNRIDQPGTPVIDYNLVWNNLIGYENTAAGANDIGFDPLYADPEAGNFDLADGSPAIDAIPLNAGDPVTDDYLGRTRPLNAGFDMGAYESTGTANRAPDAPSAASPANGGLVNETSLTLTATAFSDPDGDAQTASHWKVRRADGVYGMPDLDPSFAATIGADPLDRHQVSGLVEGMRYAWQVGYEDSAGNVAWSQENTFTVGTPGTDTAVVVKAGTTASAFRMISFPIWTTAADAAAALGIVYDPDKYRIGTYDPLTGAYQEVGDGLSLEPGRAYWFLSRNDLAPEVNGVPVTLAENVEVRLACNPGSGNGWNMIAPPNGSDYYWSDILVVERDANGNPVNGTPVSVSALVPDNDWIDVRLWRWENGAYTADADRMTHHGGFWVLAKKENVYLCFDPSYQTARLSLEKVMMAEAAHRIERLMKTGIIGPAPAYAVDLDSPPAPMSALAGDSGYSSSGGGGGGGCFIVTAAASGNATGALAKARRWTGVPGRITRGWAPVCGLGLILLVAVLAIQRRRNKP